MVKVTFDETKTQEQQKPKPFPKLMVLTEGVHKGTVVYFSKPNHGVLIKGSGQYQDEELYYTNTWVMNFFTDYNEPITITIQNQ